MIRSISQDNFSVTAGSCGAPSIIGERKHVTAPARISACNPQNKQDALKFRVQEVYLPECFGAKETHRNLPSVAEPGTSGRDTPENTFRCLQGS